MSENKFIESDKDERKGEIWTTTLPTNDIVFKEIFEKNPEFLKELINDVLCLENIEVQEIEPILTHQTEILKDPSHISERKGSVKYSNAQTRQVGLAKKSYIDVKVRDKRSGNEYIVEVQIGFTNDDYRRFSSYAYQSFIESQKPVYLITFCSSSAGRGYSGIFKEIFKDSPIAIFKPLDIYNLEKTKKHPEGVSKLINYSKQLSKNDVTKIFIDTNQHHKIKEEGDLLNKLGAFSEFFITGRTASTERALLDIQERYAQIISDPEVVNRVNAFRELEREGERALQDAKEEGEKQKALEIAQAMLGNGIPIDKIVSMTGLSESEISFLQK